MVQNALTFLNHKRGGLSFEGYLPSFKRRIFTSLNYENKHTYRHLKCYFNYKAVERMIGPYAKQMSTMANVKYNRILNIVNRKERTILTCRFICCKFHHRVVVRTVIAQVYLARQLFHRLT